MQAILRDTDRIEMAEDGQTLFTILITGINLKIISHKTPLNIQPLDNNMVLIRRNENIQWFVKD